MKDAIKMDRYESDQFHTEVISKLQEAEREAKLTNLRFSTEDVLKSIYTELAIEKGYNPRTY